MKVGIKISYSNGVTVLQQSGARHAEVWFRLDWVDRYQTLFIYLRREKIRYGLHFWGMVRQRFFPNLVYDRDGIAEETFRMIRSTIKIAAANGAFYVNYHPESFRLVELDLDRQTNRLVPGAEIDQEKGMASLLRHSQQLQCYAKPLGVETCVETVPYAIPENFTEGRKEQGRLRVVEEKGVGAKQLLRLGQAGIPLCFDIGHSTGQYPNLPRATVFARLLEDAKRLAPYTKLVHVNTTIPPLNGTDSHHGILEEDFSRNVFPDKNQLRMLLEVFAPDTLLIPEPQQEKMVDNFRSLVRLAHR
ncbi:hypothetical protein M1523_00395 [Patescibacteria group bacterium]|nr:hypothetical protein [Patescibacteria group bacterium]MCL5091904.1 hypothetical protein [Patescibacteria group bacterium]